MTNKNNVRLRRAKKTRAKIKQLSIFRLCVHRTSQHIYAQIICPEGNVKTSASTLDKEVMQECSRWSNIQAAEVVGKFIATRAKALGIEKVAFDRSGFKYHGRIAALADSARANGLVF